MSGDVDAGDSPESELHRPESESIPRHTKPFRAWGAAQERDTGPSLWERFVGWVRGLFSRPKDDEVESETDDETQGDTRDETQSDTRDETEGDTEIVEEVVVVEEVSIVEPTADSDPLWDAPAVAESTPSAAPMLEAQDFAEVWTPRDESAPAEPVAEEEPKKGFFGRLFSRKSKEQPAAAIPSEGRDLGFGVEQSSDASVLEPADADFAEDVSAAAAPSIDDFAIEAAPSSPSLDHSAEDSANLAAFLGSPPVPPAEPEPVTELPAIDEVPMLEPEPVVDTGRPTLETDVVEELPVVEPEPVAELPIVAPTADPKKAGFFSSLLKRVSRSQFIPKAAVEPEPPAMPAMELETIDAEIDLAEPVVQSEATDLDVQIPRDARDDSGEDLAAKWGPPVAAPADEDLSETVPTPMPAVPHPGKAAAESEFEATQPFPAFRDARDDFEEEKQDTGRPTEKVEMPAFDEGEKTDEFEVVPPEGAESTVETRQVAGFFGRLFGKKEEPVVVSGEAAATPAPVDEKMPFVLAKFRTFYNEVIRDKHQKSDVISGFATAVMGSPGASDTNDPEFAAQLLSKRLSEMLELQAAESNWTGGDAAKYYPEAQYAMVALADETFATIDWPGRPAWHKHMLEPRMYGTRGADLEFFKRIDKLLKDAPDDKGARDLARLYLMVIASGYRGKFRIPNVRRPLAEYRRRLYEFSHQVDPLELYARDRRVFPQAAAHTLVSRSVGRFTPAQKWLAAVLILAALYIGVSHYAWVRVSTDLRDVMSRIQTSIRQPAR